MYFKGVPKGWSKERVLAVVIPVCVAVAAVAVILVVALGRDEGGGSQAAPAGQEELMDQYEQVKLEAEGAVEQMEDLGVQEAAGDAEAYGQELEEAYDAMEQLYQDLEEAAQATEEAADEVAETSESYQELYEEMLAYYDYLQKMCGQAVAQLEYLRSVAASLGELQQLEGVAEKLEKLPAAGAQAGELSTQLTNKAVGAVLAYQGSKPAPGSLDQLSSEFSSLTSQIEALAQQMSRSLSSGDKQSFSYYAGQLTAGLAALEQQLAAEMAAAAQVFASQLSSLTSAVNSAVPE